MSRTVRVKTPLLQRSKQMGWAVHGALLPSVKETLQVCHLLNQDQSRLVLQGFWPKGVAAYPESQALSRLPHSFCTVPSVLSRHPCPLADLHSGPAQDAGMSCVSTALSPKRPQTVAPGDQLVTAWKRIQWNNPGQEPLPEGWQLSSFVCAHDSHLSLSQPSYPLQRQLHITGLCKSVDCPRN